jgi:hypothetical protein
MAARSLRCFMSALILLMAGILPNAHAETFKNPELIETTSDPLFVATADLNGDGILDLVYVDSISPYAVHILLGNGDGTFSHKSDMQLPAGIGSVINLADVTGDGVIDIIVGGAESSVGEIAVFRGKGDGTFDPAVITTVSNGGSNGGTASFAWKMGFGDINGDGVVDLVAADAMSATIYVFLGDNTGKFTLSATLSPYYFTGLTRTYLFDVNGDGHLDIVVNDLAGGETYVLLGNGNGSFKSATVYVSRALLFTDMNGDGHPDLVGMAAPGQVQILEGNADGTFGSPTLIAAVPAADTLVDAGDFNGDGVVDLLFMSPVGIGVALGQGNLAYGNVIPSVAGTVADPYYLNGFTVGSFHGKSYSDVAMTVDGGLLVLQGNGDGTFASGDSYDIGTTVGTVAVADYNGDKFPDIAITVSASYPRVLLGNGTGAFTLAPDQNSTYSTTPPSQSMITADFNGDGKKDLDILGPSSYTYQFGQPLVLYGLGNATFDPPVTINSGPALVGDFNNDGLSDMISLSSEGILVLLGQSNNTFTQVTTTINYPTSEVAAIGDFNRDGKLDALTIESGSFRVWFGNGNGTFTQGAVVNNSSQQSNPKSVLVADIDGDGNPDIVVIPYPNQNGFPLPLTFYYGNGDGTFQAPVSFPVTHAYTQVAVADVNQDNKPDLILSDGSGIAVIENQGNRTFGAEQHFVAGQNISGLSVTDVNGDGFPDIVAANYDGTTVVVLLNKPTSNSADGAWSSGSLSVSPNPDQYGQPVTFTLTLSVTSGPAPTGSVSFGVDGGFIGAASLAGGKASFIYKKALNTGGHTVVASYNGDKTYASENFSALLSVQPPVYPTNTTLVVSPTTVYTSQTVRLTSTVTGNSAAVPAGNVTFLDGNATLGVQQVYSNPLLQLDTNLLSAGTHTLTAVYQGWQDPFNEQAIYQPSTSAPVIVTVNSASTTTSLSASATSLTAGMVATFTANVASNSGVPFGGATFYDGAVPLGTSSLMADGSCSYSTASLAVGTHSITAVYNANATFASSTSSAAVVTVTSAAASLSPTFLTVAVIDNGNQSLLIAKVSAPGGIPTGKVVFLDDGNILGTATANGSGTASLAVPVLSAGAHRLSASFAGGSPFAPSVSPELLEQFPVRGSGFSLSVATDTLDVTPWGSQPALVTVVPIADFQQPVQLSCMDGVPAGYDCSFTPASLYGGNSDLRIQVSSKSATTHTRAGPPYGPVVGILSLLLIGTASRHRTAGRLFLMVCLSFMMMSGCGNPSSSGKPRMMVLSVRATAGTGVNAVVHSAEILENIRSSD